MDTIDKDKIMKDNKSNNKDIKEKRKRK